MKRNILINSIAIALVCVSLGGMFFNAPNAIDAYLTSWSFWLQFSLGAMAINLLHELTGGRWGVTLKPFLHAMMKCLWLFPILFLPLIFKVKHVYPWLQNQTLINQNETLKFRGPFYREELFAARSLIYFGIFFFINFKVFSKKKGPYSMAIGLILYVLTMSFASMDWYMSREPEWYSTVYSLVWIMAQVCSAYALVLFIKKSKDPVVVNIDQGSIFFVFLVTWIYLAFMQFLIIWEANLPKEVSWYLLRFKSGWEFVIVSIIAGSFFVPFFLLLSRKFKSNHRSLSFLALFVLVFRYLDVSWIILPASRDHFFLSLWDIMSFLGVGGLYLGVFQKKYEEIK